MNAKPPLPTEPIFYPETDGKPMAENTLQFDWITLIVGELKELHGRRDDVFVAGDLFWYPVEGMPTIVQAPDVMVAFGRPPGFRRSYRQWEEGGIAPQVIFEIYSPSNSDNDLAEKFEFYQQYGVEEYYLIDPFSQTIEGWTRRKNRLVPVRKMDGWVSPRLGIRFDTAHDELDLYTPDGRKFVQRLERVTEFQEEAARRKKELEEERQGREREKQRADREKQRADREKQRADQEKQEREREKQRADQEKQRADQQQELAEKQRQAAQQERQMREALAAKLRELGIDPDKLH